MTIFKIARCAAFSAAVLAASAVAAEQPAQPANAYRGLAPGNASYQDVVKQLGPAPIETESEQDLRYPVAGRDGLNDRLYFRGNQLALVTAASPDARYPTRRAIVAKFGTPEAEILFRTQQYLDFSEHGLRFVCTNDGKTTGVIYFQPQRRRVPAGYPNTHIDLRETPPQTAEDEKPPADFRVGAAQVSIAPLRLDNLTADGGEKPAHVAEDLFARALVFQRGDERIVLVGLDVFGLGSWDLNKLRAALAEKGFPQVVIAMSHTHANVDTIGFYGYYPRDYAQHILQRAAEAVEKAAAASAPIQRLQMGSVEMPLAGGRVVDLIRNGRDPGVVDPSVSVLQAIGADGKPIANVIHLACHPEVIRLRDTRGLSPDFVGALCKEVSRRLGGQTVFLNGALGGMLTPDNRFNNQQAAEQMGGRLAEWAVRAAKNAEPTKRYDLWMKQRPVEYPITGESVRRFLEHPPEPVDFHQGRVRTQMNVIWIGDAQLITVPGELLPDLGFEIMSHMRGRLRLIVGLANDELGYLIPSFDFRADEYEERTGPGAAGGEITRNVGLELAPLIPPARRAQAAAD